MRDLLKVLILLTVFLLPLLGPGKLGYEQTKVIFFYIMVSLSGLVWLYLIYKLKIKFQIDKLTILSGGFIVWLLISSAFGVDFVASLIGRQPYIQGFLTYLCLFIFFLVLRNSQISWKTWATTLTCSAGLVSIVAVKEWVILNLLKINILSYDGRVVSTFGQPDLYSGFVLLCLPLSFSLALKRPVWFLVIFLEILAIFSSGSRAAVLGLLVLVGILVLFKLKELKDTFRLIIGGLLIILITMAAVSFYINTTNVETAILNDPKWLIYNSPEKRIFIWPILLEAVGKRPIAGWGLENIETAFNSYQRFNGDRGPEYYGVKNLMIDRGHDYLLDLAVVSGIFGMIIWLWLFGYIFIQASYFLKITLAIYFIWNLFQIQGIAELMFFNLLASFIYIDKVPDFN